MLTDPCLYCHAACCCSPGGMPYLPYTDLASFAALNGTLESTIIICPEQTWTQDLGSTSQDQCREYPLLLVLPALL